MTRPSHRIASVRRDARTLGLSVALALLVGLALGCGRGDENAPKKSGEPVVDAGSRRVTLPADSPLLDELKIAKVESARFPSVEVVAPESLRQAVAAEVSAMTGMYHGCYLINS